MKPRNFHEVIDALRAAATAGGDASYFLARAFVSWYRPSDRCLVNLYDVMHLDPDNLRLFHEMLMLRSMPGWRDQPLYQLEQELIAYWDMRAGYEGMNSCR